MSELLPCPLCHSTDVHLGICYARDSSQKEDAARCETCGCRATKKAWQSRLSAPPPDTAGVTGEPVAWERLTAIIRPMIESVCSDGNSDAAMLAKDIADKILQLYALAGEPVAADPWARIKNEDPRLRWFLQALRHIAKTAAADPKRPLMIDEGDHICSLAADLIERATTPLDRQAVERWQPIETAPKDGTKVDLWITPPASALSGGDYGRVSDCWLSNGRWWFYDESKYASDLGNCRSEVWNVTHWMRRPIPPLPSTNKSGAA